LYRTTLVVAVDARTSTHPLSFREAPPGRILRPCPVQTRIGSLASMSLLLHTLTTASPLFTSSSLPGRRTPHGATATSHFARTSCCDVAQPQGPPFASVRATRSHCGLPTYWRDDVDADSYLPANGPVEIDPSGEPDDDAEWPIHRTYSSQPLLPPPNVRVRRDGPARHWFRRRAPRSYKPRQSYSCSSSVLVPLQRPPTAIHPSPRSR